VRLAEFVHAQLSGDILLCLRPSPLGTAPRLDAALDKLVAAGIVLPEGRSLERSFSFKHGLLRDAAYESLLLGRRREWHGGRIARALEQGFPELAANEPELTPSGLVGVGTGSSSITTLHKSSARGMA
jgi:predicted ATPase